MTPSAPTVGIIGLGYGRARIPAFQANGCKVVALCQRDQAAAQTLADALEPVTLRWRPGRFVAEGGPMEIIGKATIGPLVARFLEAIRTGTPASPSFRDGMRAQAVLDAVLDVATKRDWVEVAR